MNNTPTYIYEKTLLNLLEDHNFVEETKKQIIYNPHSNKTAVIVDPRFDNVMEAVILNFMHFMAPKGWNLLIVSWSGYEAIIKERFPSCLFYKIDDTMIEMDQYNIPNISIYSYNNIFLNANLWECIPGEHIAIFQKDCIMFHMFDEYFCLYDFAGANYYSQDHVTLYTGGINGGFSLRKKQAMIECLSKITIKDINAYRQKLNWISPERNFGMFTAGERDLINEDIYFTYACEMLHKVMPDKLTRSYLAIEADFNDETCIHHGWNKSYHSFEAAMHLLSNSEFFKKYMVILG
jgi:hypothetical protein